MRFPARALSFILLLWLAGASAQAADNDAAIAAALSAAGKWLALVDAGQPEASWDLAAPSFQAAVSRSDWAQQIAAVRGPFGQAGSREQAAVMFTRTLPGAPEGEYVVIQYRTQFASGPAVETVVPEKTADGSWKVSGYFIR